MSKEAEDLIKSFGKAFKSFESEKGRFIFDDDNGDDDDNVYDENENENNL